MAPLQRSKLRVKVKSDTAFSVEEVYDNLIQRYDISYCGTYTLEGDGYIYIQNKTKMAQSVVKNIVRQTVEVIDIEAFEEITGELLEETGEMKKPGGASGKRGKYKKRKRKSNSGSGNISNSNNNNITNNNNTINNNDNSTTNNNNVNIVVVNRIGYETTDHVTKEFIHDLLKKRLGMETLFRTGEEVYGKPENMNFKTGFKDSGFRGRVGEVGDNNWVVVSKADGYHGVMENLVCMNNELIDKYRDGIGKDDLHRFLQDSAPAEHYTLGHMESRQEVREFERYRNMQLNIMAENMAEKVRRLERISGKKIKFV